MQTLAYYASFHNAQGIALRLADGAVHFETEATGLWQTLTDADAPYLTLYGRVDIADAQMIRDGNRVVRCSRTLQEVK